MSFLYILLALAPLAAAQETLPAISTSTVLPTYLALSPNLNDFTRFADGGSDANWYIGYNNAWIVKLPPAPAGHFARAFIGARIGRAKTRPKPEKPWLREVIAGKVYMGISQVPSFSPEQSYFLVETAELPLEGSPQVHVDGVASSEWFWTEVPLSMVSFTRPNFLIVWSPTNYFTRASSAPILAAAAPEEAAENREPKAWNNRSISGVPPRSAAGTLETPLNNIHPALAIKLAPPPEFEVSVSEFWLDASGKKAVARFSAGGENISEAWVEKSRDQLDWERASRILRRQPFQFTFAADKLPAPGWYLRGAARDVLGSLGYTDPYQIPYDTPQPAEP